MISPQQLVLELWQESTSDNRCPHVGHDGKTCRCDAVGAEASELVCGHASLQLWCLDGERYPLCIFYQEAHSGLQPDKNTVQ